MLLPSGNPFKCHEEVLSLQSMIPPKRFDIFPPDWGMLRRSIGAFRCFFKIFIVHTILFRVLQDKISLTVRFSNSNVRNV